MTERWLRVTGWGGYGPSRVMVVILDSGRKAKDMDWFLRPEVPVTIVTNTDDSLVVNHDHDDQYWIYVKL